MDYKLFRFPMLEDGIVAIEKKVYELEMREKKGEHLDQVELDWLDFANSVVESHSRLF